MLEVFVALATSIPMARVIGPERLGYYSLVVWVGNMSTLIGSLGAPAAARKYIAEYLGKGQPGQARAVFEYTFKAQLYSSTGLTAIAVLLALRFGDPNYRIVTYSIVATIFPAMMLMIPAQANQAAENMRANVPATILSQMIYTGTVWLSLALGWELTGVSLGVLLYKWVEFWMRYVPARRWMATLPVEPLDEALRGRLRAFSVKSIFVMLLNILVWNRSDLIMLRWLSSDVRHLTFFSLAQNLSEKAIMLPRIFSVSVGASLLAQFGRDANRLAQMAQLAVRYALLAGLPLLWGLSAVSAALVPVLYGNRYQEAVPVLALAAMAAVPASIFLPAQNYLEATERQKYVIYCTCVAGALNIGLDYLLIPRWGPVGAAIGNGSGQLAAAAGLWGIILWKDPVKLQWGLLGRLAAAAVLLYVTAFLVARSLSPWLALAPAIASGALAFVLGLKLFGALTADDKKRLAMVTVLIPARLRGSAERVLDWLTEQTAAA
ncbi:MAG: polysaccharide biosynthesis protein [Bryobacterales bacterium]|nr:polysaccharide biosynthesis protein [Bryobacterales bacterium]